MQYVGLDVHWGQSTFCVLDENGKKVAGRTIFGGWDKVLIALSRVKGPFRVCFEASTGYGYLFEELCKIAEGVVVAHPGQLRLIFRSKKKNDRVDAGKLAKLLYLDEVPTVYVPNAEVRGWRAMIEHRRALMAERTRIKNELRALLRTHGLRAPRGLWFKKGVAWLEQQQFPTSLDAVKRDVLLERLRSLKVIIARVEKELAKVANEHVGVQLLMTIPGIGIRTAEATVAYIDNPGRFARTKGIGAYFGMVPCQDASAGKNRLGHITKEGPSSVRGLVTEAAWQAIRRSPTVRKRFERLTHGDPDRRKIAAVAVAHYLLRVMLAMLKTGEVWREEAA